MSNTYMKRHLASLTISEMQIKINMRYHLTPVRMAIINKTGDKKHCGRCGEKQTLIHYWWECKLVQSLWKISMEIPQKSKNRTTI